MNRKLHEELTLPKHPELLHELNEMSIAIKLHHIPNAEKNEKPDEWAKVQAKYKQPTWPDVLDLIHRSRAAIDEQRYNPRKY